VYIYFAWIYDEWRKWHNKTTFGKPKGDEGRKLSEWMRSQEFKRTEGEKRWEDCVGKNNWMVDG
jgi:hypothetical protein